VAAQVNLWIGEDLGSLITSFVENYEPTDEPLSSRTVVVPNPLVGQWFEQQLAQRMGSSGQLATGVAANLDVIFPSTFIGRILYDDPGDYDTWSAEGLTGHLLATRSGTGKFSITQATARAKNLHDILHLRPDDLATYLATDENARERSVLAALEAAGHESPWQRLRDTEGKEYGVGGEVTIFGCNELASGALLPYVARALGVRRRVDVYLSTPALEILRQRLDGLDSPPCLVTNWADDSLAHLMTWLTVCNEAPRTWLPRLVQGHGDRNLVRTLLEAGLTKALAAERATTWLEVHGAVGYSRQVEIARDALLHAIDELGVAPHEVRVVTTDAGRFITLMNAMWTGRGGDDVLAPSLQFEVADPSLPRSSDRLRGFTQLLRTLDSHFTLHDAVALVSEPALQQGLGLSRDAVERLIELSARSGVSLGLTGNHRADMGIFEASDDAGSWERFSDRGLLATVFESDESDPEVAIRPLGVPDDLYAMADLARLVRRLVSVQSEIGVHRPMKEWLGLYGDWADLIGRVPDAIDNGLERVMERLMSQPLPDDVTVTYDEMRELFLQASAAIGGGSVFGRGGVSVQDIYALQDAPFRVTCLMGLDEDLAPSPASPPAHLGVRRAGDPSPRNRFRSALLSTLMSTTERVIITTSDRSVRDNSPIPLVLPLAELRDALVRGGVDFTMRRHPRYAFSARIGVSSADVELDVDDVAPAFSMDVTTAELATLLHNRAAPSLDDDLPIRPADIRNVPRLAVLDIALLSRFFKDPQKVFLQTAFGGASLPEPGQELPDVPRLEVGNHLDRWSIRRAIVDRALRDGAAPLVDQHPDAALSSVATGLRRRAVQDLDVPGLRAFVERHRSDLEAVRAVRVRASQFPATVPSGALPQPLARPEVNLYDSAIGLLVVDWTVSSSFTSTFFGLFLDVATSTIERGAPVSGVLVRPAKPKEPDTGFNPHLAMQWRGDDPVDAAVRALTLLGRLYELQFDEVPIHFYETSLSGSNNDALNQVFGSSDVAKWEGGGYAAASPGERNDAVNRVLFPFDFEELEELRGGEFAVRAGQFQSAFEDVTITIPTKHDMSWVTTLGGGDGAL
jgi:hypothetical protein